MMIVVVPCAVLAVLGIVLAADFGGAARSMADANRRLPSWLTGPSWNRTLYSSTTTWRLSGVAVAILMLLGILLGLRSR